MHMVLIWRALVPIIKRFSFRAQAFAPMV